MRANRIKRPLDNESEMFMRHETSQKTAAPVSKEQMVDSSKLVSLLALAAGAVAMPETGNANVVYNDLGANAVAVGYLNSPSYTITLPGTARLEFQAFNHTTAISSIRAVKAGQVAGYVRLKTNAYFAVHIHVSDSATNPVAWSQILANTFHSGTIGGATYAKANPGSFDHDYLPFEFKDSTQGNLMLYGWVDISLSNTPLSSGEGPMVTIWRYAYDDSGVQILMGQTAVPEPASVSLMALGAMALGARGLRAWRKQRK